jgi:two-component sensor histidine kinase
MAVHELSTNAAKYGALSVEGGRVAIDWTVAEGRFHLRWEELGGPPVSPPTRKGFGSTMIERVLAEQLEGGVTIGYDPGGLVCMIDAPFGAVQDAEPT